MKSQEKIFSISDIVIILNKYKFFIVILTLLFIGISYVYTLGKKPIYTISTNLQIGSDLSVNSIKNNTSHLEIKEFSYLVDLDKIIKKMRFDTRKYKNSISKVKGSNNLIQISIKGTNSIEMKNDLLQAIESISKEYGEKKNEYLKLFDERKQFLVNKKNSIKNNLKNIEELTVIKEKLIDKLLKSNPTIASIQAIKLDSLLKEKLYLMDVLYSINDELSVYKIYENTMLSSKTKVLDGFKTSVKNPSFRLFVSIALISGLLISIFLSILFEYIKSIKKKEI